MGADGDARLTDLRFAHLTTKDGLSQDNIFAIFQDHRGFMWFATGEGLDRYDGKTFVVYKNNPDDPGTLSHNSIRDVVEDDHGYLWVVAHPGVNKFDPRTERSVRYVPDPKNPNSLANDAVWRVTRDSHGYLWFAEDTGLDRFDPATETFTHYRNDNTGQFVGRITHVIEDRHGEIWFVGELGLFHLDVKTGQITRAPGVGRIAANFIYEDSAGAFWMLAHSPMVGLVKYDRQAQRLTTYPFGPGAAGLESTTLLDDGENGFWVPSNLGLYYFDRRTASFTHLFQRDEANPDSLSDNSVVPIYRDRAGLLWIGTQNGGLNVVDFQQERFGHYTHRSADPNSLAAGTATAIYEEPNGVLWVGLFPRALDRLDRNTGKVTHFVPGFGDTDHLSEGGDLSCIVKDARGYLWIGGWGAGLDRFDERTGRFKHFRHNPADPHSLMTNNVVSVYGDPDGHIWVGQYGAVSRFDPVSEQFTNYPLGPDESAALAYTVSVFHRDRSRTLWLGTWGGVLSYFEEKTNTWVSYAPDPKDPHRLPGGSVGAIHEDRAGRLWVACGTGLYRYDRRSGIFTRFTENQGLPSNDVQGILEDAAGRLWLSTKTGISRFDPRTETFRNYDISDGLLSNNFSRSCQQRGVNGDMLFCGTNGVTTFFPERVRDNPYVPPVVITSLKIFNNPVLIGGRVLKQAIPYVNSLTLSYRDNVFSFEFAALSYANSQKNRYRFKLENFDPGWNEVDSNHSLATYTNLNPGRYVFRVQGSNSDGVWNQEGTSLAILITPPWWSTTWFRALSVICFGILLWGGLHLRVRQLREQEKKFREAVETMPALAFVNEPHGGRTFVNKAWLEYTGLSRQQAVGSGWEKAIHPDDLKRVVQRWRTSEEAGQLLEYEVRVRRGSDGAYRWFQTRARPVYDKRGKIVKWCAVSIDIEDRKRAEQLQTDLAHVSRVSTMGELAASISHELNQPIAASIMNANLALEFLGRNPPDLAQVRERTTKTMEMGTLASEIIDRLRSLYKKEPPTRKPVAVNEVISDMVELLRGQAMRHGISVRADFATGLPNVIADRVQVQQVLMNLMLNGIEAMSDTGGVLTLISQVLESGQVEISVRDTGPGLPPGKADQIFDAFFTTKPQGSGMGLAISKSIVESHGGRIWATHNSGRGAAFHFTLPPAPDTEVAGV